MKFELYQDTSTNWRWRVKTGNGRVVGDSAESYKNPGDCMKGFNRLWKTSLVEIRDGCHAAGFEYDCVTGRIKKIDERAQETQRSDASAS